MKLRRNVLLPLQLDTRPALNAMRVPAHVEEHWLRRLAAIRDTMVCDSMVCDSMVGDSHALPNEAFFVRLPSLLLDEYAQDRRNSQLGRLFQCATNLHAIVDRVVVLSNDRISDAARALLDSCCQPYWNELSRAERGSKPRIYFNDGGMDNDATQALLHLLEAHKGRPALDELDRWALVFVETTSWEGQPPSILKYFLDAHRRNTPRNNPNQELIIHVRSNREPSILPPDHSILATFQIPESPFETFGIFTLAGLVPAAALGINVVELLQGAAAMTEHFARAAADENLVLRFAAMNLLFRDQLFRDKCNVSNRIVSCWSHSLHSFSKWSERLLSDCLSSAGDRAVLVRSLNLNSELFPDSRIRFPNSIYHHFLVNEYRFDDLGGTRSRETTNSVVNWQTESGIPYSTCHIPRSDELHMGQLMQLMMLATEVERRFDAGEAMA